MLPIGSMSAMQAWLLCEREGTQLACLVLSSFAGVGVSERHNHALSVARNLAVAGVQWYNQLMLCFETTVQHDPEQSSLTCTVPVNH